MRDKAGIGKGKEKASEDALVVTRTYPTKGTHRIILSDVIAVNKCRDAKKRKLRSTTAMEDEEVPNNKLVDMDIEGENSKIKFDEDLVHLRLHTKIIKSFSKGIEGSKKNPKNQEKDEENPNGVTLSHSGTRLTSEKVKGRESVN